MVMQGVNMSTLEERFLRKSFNAVDASGRLISRYIVIEISRMKIINPVINGKSSGVFIVNWCAWFRALCPGF